MSEAWFPDESEDSPAWFEAKWARLLGLIVSLPTAIVAGALTVASVASGSPGGLVLGGLAGVAGFVVISLSWRGFVRLEYPAFVHLFAVSVTIIVLSLPFVALRAAVLAAVPATGTTVEVVFWTPNEPLDEIATKLTIGEDVSYKDGSGPVIVHVLAVEGAAVEGLAESEIRCRVIVDGEVVQEAVGAEGRVTCTHG